MISDASLPTMGGVCLTKVEGNYPGQSKAAPSRAARPRRWDIGEIKHAVSSNERSSSERDLFVREQGLRWCINLVQGGSACKATLSTMRATCLSKFVPPVMGIAPQQARGHLRLGRQKRKQP
ncbi:unnamed protein product [Linum trigynum]|uniref:Uncharacterized protein n=1 Tax=Linum trigynum TaxID=586398 RepID=A0AAV2EQ08_9ROSI